MLIFKVGSRISVYICWLILQSLSYRIRSTILSSWIPLSVSLKQNQNLKTSMKHPWVQIFMDSSSFTLSNFACSHLDSRSFLKIITNLVLAPQALFCVQGFSRSGMGFSCFRAKVRGIWASVVAARELSSCGTWA